MNYDNLGNWDSAWSCCGKSEGNFICEEEIGMWTIDLLYSGLYFNPFSIYSSIIFAEITFLSTQNISGFLLQFSPCNFLTCFFISVHVIFVNARISSNKINIAHISRLITVYQYVIATKAMERSISVSSNGNSLKQRLVMLLR